MRHSLLIAAASLLLVSLPCAAASKVVGKGETWTVTAADAQSTLDSLTLGDGATIRFAGDMKYWDLRVKSAVIGQDVKIDARGTAGPDGKAGASITEEASGCAAGDGGGDSGSGGDGGYGVNLDLQLGVVSLGSLDILADGGEGGKGGTGGKGQDAGSASSCSATRGGRGGNGGAGGDGGNGGNISLTHWNASGTDIGNINHRINVSVEGGQAGKGGDGGEGGKGSPGHYINKRSLSGNQTWQAGGKNGETGAGGVPGQAGKPGRSMVTERTGGYSAPPSVTPVASQQDKTQSAEIDLLKQQLQEMQKRLDSIEKR